MRNESATWHLQLLLTQIIHAFIVSPSISLWNMFRVIISSLFVNFFLFRNSWGLIIEWSAWLLCHGCWLTENWNSNEEEKVIFKVEFKGKRSLKNSHLNLEVVVSLLEICRLALFSDTRSQSGGNMQMIAWELIACFTLRN